MKDERTLSRAQSAEVRYATPADIHALMDIGFLAAHENGLGAPNTQKMLQLMWRACTHNKAIAGVIEGPTGELEAATLLVIEEQGHTCEPVLVEQSVYVRPEFRSARGGRAAKLTEFNKSVALRLGLPLLIGVLSNERTAAKIRLYERIFGKPAGAYWLFNARTGNAEPQAAE